VAHYRPIDPVIRSDRFPATLMRMSFKQVLRTVLPALLLIPCGCHVAPLRTAMTPPEPIFIAASDSEFVWERLVDVLHDYPFAIKRENKLDGVIETEYKTGSNLLEPWHRDSPGLKNRLESGLQTIRRKVFLTMTPVEGGYVVTVRAEKEIRSTNGHPSINTAGGATFQENQPLQRDLTAVLGPARQAGWVRRGRDYTLEHALAARVQAVFAPR